MTKLYVSANSILGLNYGHLQIVKGDKPNWESSNLAEVEVQKPISGSKWDFKDFGKKFDANNNRYGYAEISLKSTQSVESVWALLEQVYNSLKKNGANL